MTDKTQPETIVADELVIPASTSADLAKISAVAKKVSDLKTRFGGVIYDVKTDEGMTAAKAARKEVRSVRTQLEKDREAAKAPVLTLERMIDGTAKVYRLALEAIEGPIDDQIKAEELRLEQIRAEAARKQEELAQAIQARILEIQQMPAAVRGEPLAAIQAQIEKLDGIHIDTELFGTRVDEALASRRMARVTLTTMADDAKKAEDDAAERERQLQVAQQAAAAAELVAEEAKRAQRWAEIIAKVFSASAAAWQGTAAARQEARDLLAKEEPALMEECPPDLQSNLATAFSTTLAAFENGIAAAQQAEALAAQQAEAAVTQAAEQVREMDAAPAAPKTEESSAQPEAADQQPASDEAALIDAVEATDTTRHADAARVVQTLAQYWDEEPAAVLAWLRSIDWSAVTLD